MTGADAIVRCLELEKVSYVFGYPGVAICPFFDSLESTDIESILVRTEQNAAHEANGYARISGKPGVCAVTSGPGATNVITGIATAFADSIPLIVITGQVESRRLGCLSGGGYLRCLGILCKIQLYSSQCGRNSEGL